MVLPVPLLASRCCPFRGSVLPPPPHLPRLYEQNCRRFSLVVAQLVSLSVFQTMCPRLSLCVQVLTPGIFYYYVTELAFYWSLMFSQFTDIKRKVRRFSCTLCNYHQGFYSRAKLAVCRRSEERERKVTCGLFVVFPLLRGRRGSVSERFVFCSTRAPAVM